MVYLGRRKLMKGNNYSVLITVPASVIEMAGLKPGDYMDLWREESGRAFVAARIDAKEVFGVPVIDEAD